MSKKRDTYPQYKKDTIDSYKKMFENSSITILLNYKGTTASDIAEFRKKLSTNQSKLTVIKNRLAKIAFKDLKIDLLSEKLKGDSALIVSYNEDTVLATKQVVGELKALENVKLLGGLLLEDKSNWLTDNDIKHISSLTSKEELIAKLLYCLNAPAQNLARTLNEIPSRFVRVISAIAKK